MDTQVIFQRRDDAPPYAPTMPRHKVVEAVARADIDRIVALLTGSGLARERIEVIIVEEVPRLEDPLGGTGLHRYLVRLQLSRGDELDELELARRELMNGHALIRIVVHGDQELDRVNRLLGQHRGRSGQEPGRWILTMQ